MSNVNDEASIGGAVRQGQIIVIALALGVTAFLVLAIVVNPGANPVGPAAGAGAAAPRQGPDVGQLLTWIAVAMTATLLPLSFIVPELIAGQNRRAIAAGKWTLPQGRGGAQVSLYSPEALATDAGKLAVVYSIQLIVGAALNEAPAFLAGVAYLIGKDPIALGGGLALVGVLLARIPTRQRVASWIERQEELLISERQAVT